jgi:hypothetical protein
MGWAGVRAGSARDVVDVERDVAQANVTIVEPSDTHWYQPLFTLVGGGAAVLSDASRVRELEYDMFRAVAGLENGV